MPRKSFIRSSQAKTKLPPHVVTKRSGTEWHVRIFVPTHLRNEKGKIIYEQFTRRCEPKTAERAAEIVAVLQTQINGNQIEISESSTVIEFLEKFLALKKKSVETRTYQYYENLLNNHLKESTIARWKLHDLTTLGLQKFYDTLIEGKTSISMVRKINVFLSMAFKKAIQWDDLSKNPCAGIMLPKAKTKETLAMSQAEAKRFLDACRSDDRYIIFEFALETGLRPQEVTGIRWSDIDLQKRKLKVTQAVVADLDHKNRRIGNPKTEASIRTNGFSERLRERLLRHQDLQTEAIHFARQNAQTRLLLKHKRATGINYKRRRTKKTIAKETVENYGKFNLVFPALNGKPMDLKNLNRRELVEVLKKANITVKKYTFESLRHTCLTFLADHLNPKKLQKFAGHAELTTTMKYYVHVDDEAQYEASEKMAEMLY